MIWATLGGVTVGLCLLVWEAVRWWPGRKALQKKPLEHVGRLVPFVFGCAYGVLGITATIGLIGWGFDTALWASNWLGDAALWLGVGQAPGQVSHGAYQPLTAFGNCAVLVVTAGTIAAIKFTPVGLVIKRGAWCGLCLGTSSGVAGLAAVPLAQGINQLGDLIYGVA